MRFLCSLSAMFAIAISLNMSQPVAAQSDMDKGDVKLESAGPMAFAPDGVLLVGDTKAAKVYAIQTGESAADPEAVTIKVDDLGSSLGAALGIDSEEVMINDMAVNPKTGTAYLSVSRGRSPEAPVVLMQVKNGGEMSELSLEGVHFASVELPNVPDQEARGRRGPLRTFSITDIGFVDNRVVVAGLSNEEFSSNLRAIDYPFSNANDGTTVEVYHGAHGRFETNAPVRTFTPVSINNKPFIVAAYTCTPLVKFPLSDISENDKLTGTTIAELGNRNNPLDMFVYEKGGEEYILMANSARGTMKISTKDMDRDEGIEERVDGTAGQTYDTIKELEGVVQLDRLNKTHALVVISKDGKLSLRSVELP